MKEKKEKRRYGLIIFIVLIMIGTSFGVFIGTTGNSQKVRYNNIVFSFNGNYWMAKINGAQAAFSFQPKDVESIYMAPGIKGMLANRLEIDSTSEYNSTANQQIALAQRNIGLTLANYRIYLRQGFTAPNPYNLPVFNCSAATENVPVIYFTLSNETKVFSEDNCIILQASKPAEVEKAKDRLLYSILGVI